LTWSLVEDQVVAYFPRRCPITLEVYLPRRHRTGLRKSHRDAIPVKLVFAARLSAVGTAYMSELPSAFSTSLPMN
jgi:hypothetical protein